MTGTTITQYPDNIKFKYSWRKYQQRVLDELRKHIADRHLHVVAPPGSGKTILGLEVARRLNKPTLILAPTVAIRNQWIQRFCDLFLQTDAVPDWISRDVRNPKFLTVSTYQGLHAACTNAKTIDDEIEDDEAAITDEPVVTPKNKKDKNNFAAIIKGLKEQKIKTIVVDEAHHLKNEWWSTLTKIKTEIDPVIVGLTATPPYDVVYSEWARYLDLNGLVDAEITVPELVAEGDLCPHQDFIYFSSPSAIEIKKIEKARENIATVFKEIRNDEQLIDAIANCPIYNTPELYADWIYSNISYYSAVLIFLNDRGIIIDEKHIEIVGNTETKLPPLDYEWMELLLDFYLHKEKALFETNKEHQKLLEKKLRYYGALEHGQICFVENKEVSSFLTSSVSKLNAIQEIVDFEYKQLGSELRMVILTDYIRKELLTGEKEDNTAKNKMGVIPIFENLRRGNIDNVKIGVLTGSLIIIPKSASQLLLQKTSKYGIDVIECTPLYFDKSYLQINLTEKLKHNIVHVITEVFQEGGIEVLIGTKSLLGEGWDAPAINALILASFVGSFVLSNQMRGRAIRTQQGNSYKTGNIWHLVCLDPFLPTGGADLELLQRRFKSFVGITANANIDKGIEGGINRLNIPDDIYTGNVYKQINARTFAIAAKRDLLKEQWDKALANGTALVEEIKIPYPKKERGYAATKTIYLNRTVGFAFAQLFSVFFVFGEWMLFRVLGLLDGVGSMTDLATVVSVLGGVGVIVFGGQAYKSFKAYAKYRNIADDLNKIGKVLLNSLYEAGVIKTENVTVVAEVDGSGSVYCHISGGTTFEKAAFIKALQELTDPIDNPRYIIERHSQLLSLIDQKDYHAVPEELAKNKTYAEYFCKQWQQLVGECSLVFTRNQEGRKYLLQCRVDSLAGQLNNKIERVNKWR
jgi:superfamily II DNA or RNA helicase